MVPVTTNDDVLKHYGGKGRNDLNELLFSSDQQSYENDMSTCSPYLMLSQVPSVVKKYANGFSVLSLNCQSINAKFDFVKLLLAEMTNNNFKFSAICLQESWLSGNPPDTSLFHLPGYQTFALGATCSSHGGLLIYLSSEYNATVRDLYKTSKIWEGLFLNITGNGIKPFTLGTIYRPPRHNNNNESVASFLLEITPVIETLGNESKNAILCGDFNLNLLIMNQRDKYSEFFDLMLNNGFLPKIALPTRLSKYSATLLDQMYIKDHRATIVQSNSGIIYSSISDHLAYFTCLKLSTKLETPPKFVTIEQNDDASVNAFITEIESANILDKLDKSILYDPNKTYATIEKIIQDAKNRHMPTKTVKFNKYKHKMSNWITQGILNSIRHKDKLYAQLNSCHRLSPDYEMKKINFATYSKMLKKSIREAKKTYYDQEFQKYKNDISSTWNTINSILNRNHKKNNITHLVTTNGSLNDKQDIAEYLNTFFSNIGCEQAAKLPSPRRAYTDYLNKTITFSFSFALTSPESIEKIIDKFKPKTSAGHDGLSMKLLKKLKRNLSGPISLLTNQSLITGTFPDQFKLAKVLPLLKKANDFTTNNFRPISLLPAISKILEKAVFNQLYDYFSENNLFYDSQYGYRKKHSTETACLELVDKIYQNLDNNRLPITFFLDLSKAFDTLNHSILLRKLQYYGVSASALSWFKSYLANRKQYVQIDTCRSSTQNITTGVPQGSILGPLLFIIYMNDINTVSDKFEFILYADDTSLNSTICTFKLNNNDHNISEIINNELSRINDWLIANKLSLNTSKTKYMIFHYPQYPIRNIPNLQLKINDMMISQVHEFNFLGLILSETMSWSQHCNKVATKVSKAIGIMSKMKRVLNKHILLKIYNTLILSHFNYAILCWGFQHARLIKLQKKALRIICKTKYNAHTDPLFKQLQTLKLSDIFNIQCMKFYYNHENNLLPKYFTHIYRRNMEIHTYHTRQSQNLHVFPYRKSNTRNTVRHHIPTLINDLPQCIVEKVKTHSLPSIKAAIKKHYLDQYLETCTIPNCYICGRTREQQSE